MPRLVVGVPLAGKFAEAIVEPFLVALTKVAATDVNLKGLRMARRVGKSRK